VNYVNQNEHNLDLGSFDRSDEVSGTVKDAERLENLRDRKILNKESDIFRCLA
jgi:hypothetical protein